MEEVKNNQGQTLGIAALITAIITFIIAVIPCIGTVAIVPGIIAVILAGVGISQASRNNAPKGLLIAGLIIGVVATIISVSQIFVAAKLANSSGDWATEIQKVVDEVQDDVRDELEDQNISIKIESNGDKVEINAGKDKSGLEKKLEVLEGDTTAGKGTLQKEK